MNYFQYNALRNATRGTYIWRMAQVWVEILNEQRGTQLPRKRKTDAVPLTRIETKVARERGHMLHAAARTCPSDPERRAAYLLSVGAHPDHILHYFGRK